MRTRRVEGLGPPAPCLAGDLDAPSRFVPVRRPRCALRLPDDRHRHRLRRAAAGPPVDRRDSGESERARGIVATVHRDRHVLRRQKYLQKFYDVTEELPTHYDPVINTDTLDPEHATAAVLAVARAAT
jgi:hypothetical protein